MNKYVPPSDKFRLVAFTQDHENYGEPGSPDYWKPKGGSEWAVKELTLKEVVDLAYTGLQAIVHAAQGTIEQNGDMFKSFLVDWELYAPGESTPDEWNYQEYSGVIPEHCSPVSVDWWREARQRSAA